MQKKLFYIIFPLMQSSITYSIDENNQYAMSDDYATRSGDQESHQNIISNLLGIFAHSYVAMSDKTSMRSREEAIINAITNVQSLVTTIKESTKSNTISYDTIITLKEILSNVEFMEELRAILELEMNK